MAERPPDEQDEESYHSSKKLKATVVDHTYTDYSQHYVQPVLPGREEEEGKKQPTFPAKLHEILSNEEYRHIIGWMPHGRSWIIVDKEKLIEVVLPKHFTSNKFESFNRQVNGWGFKRFHGEGPDHRSYYHELFLRGRPELTTLMARLINPGKRLPDKANEPDLYRISSLYPLPPGPSVAIRGLPREYIASYPPQAPTHQQNQPPQQPPVQPPQPQVPAYGHDPRTTQPPLPPQYVPTAAAYQGVHPYVQNPLQPQYWQFPYPMYPNFPQPYFAGGYPQPFASPAQQPPQPPPGWGQAWQSPQVPAQYPPPLQYPSQQHVFYQNPPPPQEYQRQPVSSQTFPTSQSQGSERSVSSTPARQGGSQYAPTDTGYETQKEYFSRTHGRQSEMLTTRRETSEYVQKERSGSAHDRASSYERKRPPELNPENWQQFSSADDRYPAERGEATGTAASEIFHMHRIRSGAGDSWGGNRPGEHLYESQAAAAAAAAASYPLREDDAGAATHSTWTPPRSRYESQQRDLKRPRSEYKDHSHDESAPSRARHSAPPKIAHYEPSYHRASASSEDVDDRKLPARTPQHQEPKGQSSRMPQNYWGQQSHPTFHQRPATDSTEGRFMRPPRAYAEGTADYAGGDQGVEESLLHDFADKFARDSSQDAP